MAAELSQPLTRHSAALRKVPEITIYFWIAKLLSTAMGEAMSDFLVYQINPYVAVILGCLGFALALALQFWVRRYIAWVYWPARALLLGHSDRDLRVGDRGWGSDRGHVRTWVRLLPGGLRHHLRDAGAGLLAVRPQRDLRVLVRLRSDPAAGGLLCRLDRQAVSRGPGAGGWQSRGGSDPAHHHRGRLPIVLARRCPGAI